jgi:hypothetical protein
MALAVRSPSKSGEPLGDLAYQQAALRRLGAVGVVDVDIVGDIAERTAETFAAQDPDQPRAIAAAEHPRPADPLGFQQALALVEADWRFRVTIGDGCDAIIDPELTNRGVRRDGGAGHQNDAVAMRDAGAISIGGERRHRRGQVDRAV